MSTSADGLQAADFRAPDSLNGLRSRALLIGLVASALAVIGALTDSAQFYRSYLVGYLLWLGVAGGCVAIGMLQHITTGAWGVVGRRVFEAGQRTLPAMLVLFVPIVLGMTDLYSWARPEVVEHDELIQHKAAYLNQSGFIIRAAVYFVIWIGVTRLVNSWSVKQDSDSDPRYVRSMRRVSGPAVGIYFLTATFASIDWLMSLEPHWFSSIYGVWFAGGQGLSALAWVILTFRYLSLREPMQAHLTKKHFADYGNLMFAFVCLWAYFSLSQFLIIWSGNLPEETFWYIQRLDAGWQQIAIALVAFHFGLPFLVLLSRFVKQSSFVLSIVAGLILVMRWVDLYWQVAPTFSEAVSLHWLDPIIPIAIGGLWVALFATELKKHPLLPVGDPNVKGALQHV